MSYVALAYFGMLPLGSLVIGGISQQIGAPNTIFWEGVLSLIVAGVFSKFLRRDKLNKREMAEIK